jgi:RHS repeat-associated protein
MDGTGLQYNRARYYDKAIGRWNRQDDYRGEMSVPASLHRYQYVFNNPVNYSDPSGMIVDESEGNTWQYFLATFTIILQETRHDVNAQGLSKYTAAVAQAKRLRSFGILGAILGTILFTTIDLVGIFLDDQRTLCQFLKIFVVLKLVAASLYFGSAIGAIGVFASSGVLLIGAAITIGAIMNWMRESAFFVIDNELDCYGCRERK